MMKKILYILLILLTCSLANASSNKIYSHPEPLLDEMLKKPIKLKCGATIKEWHRNITKLDLVKVDLLCSFALNNFHNFVNKRGFITNKSSNFSYNISFLPDTKSYRGLNDIKYRFRDRLIQRDDISGYTEHNIKYIFNIDDVKDPEFDVSFVHELFHAMSHYYGVFNQYDGSIEQKLEYDEVMAQKFTKFLNLGY